MDLPYDLKDPAKKYELPNKYMEISGICPIHEYNSLAFVQDEAVRVYQFDLSTEEITEYVEHEPGDSEDIAIIGNTAYILRAGERPAIYRITGYNSGTARCERYDLNLNKDYDPEGLCHDAKKNRLLIACKGSPIKGDTIRKIFSFDIQSGTRAYAPIFAIDSREFLEEPGDTFNPSGIAIHPKSNDVYLIGTKGVKMLVCYGLDGKFKGSWELDKKQFVQPEGIAFNDSGELIISSEGKKGKKGKKTRKARVFIFSARGQSV